MSKNPKNWWKLMKIANIDREILHIFWTTWGIPMKFSGKMWLMIIIEVTKNQGFNLSLKDTFFKKPQGDQIDPPSQFRVNLTLILQSLCAEPLYFLVIWQRSLTLISPST